MYVKEFAAYIKDMGISTITGVPDSTLKAFCDYMSQEGQEIFCHYVPANEGAAVGIAIGSYLATGKPVCIYAQNSGLGNMVNPVTSLANEAVYGIPMLMLIGWRGEPGTKDEPQHKFMGTVTESMLETLQIEYEVLSKELSENDLVSAFSQAKKALDANKQFAFVIKRDFFDVPENSLYQNQYTLVREQAIREVFSRMQDGDILVSTTGKISREVYEQSEKIRGNHNQSFLTVGGMGHASMIAFGIAKEKPEKLVYCLDGDGAVLMHMGSLAFLGKQKPENFIHICLNNDAHESVGGMPTGSAGLSYAKTAAACGYPAVYTAGTMQQLADALVQAQSRSELSFLEIHVSMESRADLGRPKESAADNKMQFMSYLAKDS